MTSNLLQYLPFYCVDTSQLLSLYDSSTTNPAINMLINASTSSHSAPTDNNNLNNTGQFEEFLIGQDDLKFLNTCKYYSPYLASQNISSQNNCLILYINARSIPKNFLKLKLLITELQVSPIVICVTETWLTDLNFKNYVLPGYSLEVCNRQNKIGGGVCNYIRDDLNYNLVQNHTLSSSLAMEGIITKIKLEVGNHTYSIINLTIYRPPNTCVEQFIDQLDNILHDINKTANNKNIVVMAGDFNIDLAKINQHDSTLKFFNTLLIYNLIPTITKPTRVTEFSATLIDNIFINDLLATNNTYVPGIIVSDLSDHFPCFLNLQLNCINPKKLKKEPKYIRKFNSQNYATFAQLLKSINWEKYNDDLNYSNINDYFDTFHKEFVINFDNAFPLVDAYQEKTKNIHLPWLTTAIVTSCKVKNKLYKKYKKYPSLLNLTNYKNYNNKLQQCISSAEQKYYMEKLQKSKDDTKSKWLLINQILNKNNVNNTINTFTINGHATTDVKLIAETFNSYYINLGSSLASNIPQAMYSPFDYLKNKQVNSAVFHSTTSLEIISIINNLKNDSSPGWDDIPNSVIKFSKKFISIPLANIVNYMINVGSFPDQLKIAKVVPCYKSGDKSVILNYRPISILNSFSKIFEKIIVNRLKSYITKYNILYKYQFGFRENYSTNLALITYIDYITKAIDTGDKVASVYIDLSKAFDTLNHEILLKKLNLYGIRGQVLSLFNSYLTNRKQYVQYNNYKSSLQTITCGVPQGSILGPILFLLYINDIHNSTTLLKIILFADDTTLTFKHKNINELMRIVNVELGKIADWMKSNKLSINISKTFYVLFRPTKNIIPNIALSIDGNEIVKVSSIKFLGITIDDKLSWKVHIKNLECKISALIGILSKIRYKINSDVSNLIYEAFIMSQLNYCNIIWSSGYKTNVRKLENLQARALKICNRLDYKTSKDKTFIILNRISLTNLNKFNILKFVYNVLNRNLTNLFQDFYIINKDKHRQATRLQNNIFITSVKTNIRKMFVAHRGSLLWNKLPEFIKSLATLSSFKTETKKLLLMST
jgi:hypothetical protein